MSKVFSCVQLGDLNSLFVQDKPIPGPGGFADDYAWMVAAYLDLYEATTDHNYIQRALALQDLMDAKFKSGDRLMDFSLYLHSLTR